MFLHVSAVLGVRLGVAGGILDDLQADLAPWRAGRGAVLIEPFVIFDLEAVFLFTYAIAVREVGWAGYIEVLIFIGILMAALIYLWRLGALDWRTKKQIQQQSSYKKY